MRTRSGVIAALLCGLAVLAPAAANASPRHNHGLTIATTANPIVDGQSVDIYGQLTGVNSAGQTIYLYHRVAPNARFSLIQTTQTSSTGYYEFTRADGIVTTNRAWFVRGPNGTHSRTLYERVAAALTLTASTSATTTSEPVTFTGTVAPNHPFTRVAIQEQNSISGSGWVTIARGYTNAASAFTITHRFRTPGAYTLRAYLHGDARSAGAGSDSVTLAVQQQQNADFTIGSSSPIVADGGSVSISGTLTAATSANVPVTLYAKPEGGHWQAIANATTDGSGAYSFTQTPVHNTVYVVRTTGTPTTSTATLLQGVQDVVTLTPQAVTAQEGQAVTFTGNVTPDHTGHWIYLQVQGPKGGWQDVEATRVGAGSRFSFTVRPGTLGTFTLRARIFGGPLNIGAASPTASITVSGVAPASSLPAAS